MPSIELLRQVGAINQSFYKDGLLSFIKVSRRMVGAFNQSFYQDGRVSFGCRTASLHIRAGTQLNN